MTPSTGSVVTVDGARCTTIRGFTITGPSDVTGRNGTGVNVINGGSAVIDSNIITFDTTNPISGLQQGRGINVDLASCAMILNNSVSNYQKTGIRINGAGTSAMVFNNIVTGVGATNLIAQNGIQVSRGATSLVQGNMVSGNNYTVAGTSSAGILLFQVVATAPVVVQFNPIVTSNNLGIALSQTVGTLIQGNTASGNNQDGFYVDDTSISNKFIQNTALGNTIYDFEDLSVGVLSAGTGNVYLCNTCNTDNRGGQICMSMSPIVSIPMSSATIRTLFLPPVVPSEKTLSPN